MNKFFIVFSLSLTFVEMSTIIFYIIFISLLFKLHFCEVFNQINCESYVTSNNATYKGCAYLVPTESLSNDTNIRNKVIYNFRGIPYATPPIGELRFRRTEPLIYERPVSIDTEFYGKSCMQPVIRAGSISEDCLYLNIWTPTLDTSSQLPVMFFIHGGGFTVGSGNQVTLNTLSLSNVYGGEFLALRNVVVVNFNYRLGLWGWLYCNSSQCPGNMGYWDQAMALNWTKDNIISFGGNPDQITLFGESAGSIAISNHLISNVTRNWFKRAIMQSGSAYNKYWSKDTEYAFGISRKFASDPLLFPDSEICTDDNTWIECLRSKSPSELLEAQKLARVHWLPRDPWITIELSSHFRPVFGDQFIPISVNRAVKMGDIQKDIDLIIGHNEMEGAVVLLLFDLLVGLLGRYNTFNPRPLWISKSVVYNDIKNVLIENKTISERIATNFTQPFGRISVGLNPNPIRKAVAHMFGDYSLTCPTVLFGAYIRKIPEFTGKVFQYRLTSATRQSIASYSNWAEVSHTDELPLVFGHPFKPYERFLWSESDRKLSQQIMDIWIYFARHGAVPLVNGNIWPEYGLKEDKSIDIKYVEFNSNDKIMGKIHNNSYDGIEDQFYPSLINNCFYYWDKIISEQF